MRSGGHRPFVQPEGESAGEAFLFGGIMLTQEQLKEELDYDQFTGIFKWKKNYGSVRCGSIAGSLSNGYLRIVVLTKRYRAHRLAWLYMYGSFPKNTIDHIDGNRSNNRIKNLRDVSNAINIQNQRIPHKNNTTGYLGVTFSKMCSKYIATVYKSGVKHHIGYFDTAQEAGDAYIKAKRNIHEGCTI